MQNHTTCTERQGTIHNFL